MTDRHRFATNLSEHGYQLLVNAIVDYAIYMINLDGHISSWNAGAERIKGYRAEEILGEPFSRFFSEEDRDQGLPQRSLQIALNEGRHQGEGWRIRKDGTRFWALAVLDAVYDESGQIIGFAKITRDLSDERRTHHALVDSERQFRLLVDGVSDYAIYLLDPEGFIVSWNNGAQRIKGYQAEDIIGAHFSRFYTEEDRRHQLPQHALRSALDNRRYEAEGWRVRRDGERFWASVVIDAIHDEEGRHVGFAKVTRDITERVETQQRLDEAREQLFQAQKMEALGQFTGGLAHDFNNLLTVILGATDLALRLSGDARLNKLLENTRQAALRGGDITRQLLSFARRKPLETHRVELGELLENSAPLLQQSLRSDIRLLLYIGENLHPLQIDPAELELALLNLVINARDAIEEAGEIHLRAENVLLEERHDGLCGDFVALSVRDTGRGMPAEVRSRVFEPFFTTKTFGKGTGLGLAQVHGFAQQSRGAVDVRSEPAQGTCFTLYLPALEDGAALQPQVPRILLVEDDEVLADVTASMLETMGYRVESVGDADQALQRLLRSSGYRLLLSDVIMPGRTNGLELANKVRERLPELPILLTSGYSEIVIDGHSAYPLLPKPFSYDGLAQAVQRLLGPAD
ncbi:PAS domain S-box protein [Pseudomonas sp.]|uniref:hybrid sensor histidine kinase/response regulator n=1 Tax=Pseudomonas sp. TaxID=306 RepID=UPI0028AD07D7|nr:PAS domain S-box protein [Pseudomonas sp.]